MRWWPTPANDGYLDPYQGDNHFLESTAPPSVEPGIENRRGRKKPAVSQIPVMENFDDHKLHLNIAKNGAPDATDTEHNSDEEAHSGNEVDMSEDDFKQTGLTIKSASQKITLPGMGKSDEIHARYRRMMEESNTEVDNALDEEDSGTYGKYRFVNTGSGAKEWTRDDAVITLGHECYIHGLPGVLEGTPDKRHPLYQLFTETVIAIDTFFEEQKQQLEKQQTTNQKRSKAEVSVIRRTKNPLLEASIAFYNRGHILKKGKPVHWETKVLVRSTILAIRCANPFGSHNGSIMGRLGTVGRGYHVAIPNKANSHSLDVEAYAAFAADAATVARMAEAKSTRFKLS